ncbi:MAG TPA: YdcF family protein [Oscillatoriales cyanobacterium M59_W2019_021]|nr:MAG: YdcF family protein [Cyanobacteria bacterium J055]HIK32395.1 YdcF family protein [Oscillatoriales cyanobacterium M4454_W2019_049]HIK49537.1 YdcF family protein [Oscillatoriales cyanobacterium M59_W2019_021]
MFLLITRLILWLLILWAFWHFFKKIVPGNWYTYLGIFGLVILLFLFLFDPTDRIAYAAWQIISFPLRPLGLALILLSIPVLGRKGKFNDNSVTQITLAFWILLISSLPIVPRLIYQNFLERDVQVLVDRPAAGANAIVLLGQGTTEPQIGGRSQIQLTDAGNLIPYTAEVYRNLGGPPVIVSAGRRTGLPTAAGEQIEAEDIRSLLEGQGVSPADIIIEPEGLNLRTSAINVKKTLDETGLGNRVVLVSSSTQIYRATQTFKNVGIDVVPRPTNFVGYRFPDTNLLSQISLNDFIPSLRGLATSSQITDEYLATMYYFLRGWLSPDELNRPGL